MDLWVLHYSVEYIYTYFRRDLSETDHVSEPVFDKFLTELNVKGNFESLACTLLDP